MFTSSPCLYTSSHSTPLQWRPASGVVPKSLARATEYVNRFRYSGASKVLAHYNNPSASAANMVCMAGGSWYIPVDGLVPLWTAAAANMQRQVPVYLTETKSRCSPDELLAFFIDIDCKRPVPDRCIPEFVVDVIELVTTTLEIAGVRIPDANLCLSIATSSTSTKFGCHIVLNSILTDSIERRRLTNIAQQLWPDFAWGEDVFIDGEATTSLRTILSNKIARFPVLEKKPVPLDQGRMYDILCICDYTSDNGFVQVSATTYAALVKRHTMPPPSPIFKSRNVVMSRGVVESAEVCIEPASHCPVNAALSVHVDDVMKFRPDYPVFVLPEIQAIL